ncbi:phasin family protein [Vogesella amnigena]|uniref:Phasin family protein n=1 Tax=Vogesella amnigena TaxID=1507449 RepID=A0ABV7TVE5_9NEIS
MFTNVQELSAFGQAQFDKAVRLSSIMLASAERLTSLQLEITRKVLAENAETVKQLTGIKDPKSLAEFQAGLVQPNLDKTLATAREVYDATVATQTELTSFVEEQVAETNKQVLEALDRLAKHAPAGSESAVQVLKNLVNSGNAAFETASKTAKKVGSDFAEASVEAAKTSANAATAAVSRARKAATPAA